jgi:DNA-binding NarL/FixJ family response regulator
MANATDQEQNARIRILLVDDNLTFRRNAMALLQPQHELDSVGWAHRGANALVKAQELCPEVIVIDLWMPGLSGRETIPRLKNMLPAAGIIALNVLDSGVMRQAALAAGAHDLVAKANLHTELLPAIRQVAQAVRASRACCWGDVTALAPELQRPPGGLAQCQARQNNDW